MAASKSDRDFLSEIIIIISGFILAETFVRKIIEGSIGLIPWYILPALAIQFLVLAFAIRNEETNGWFYYLSYLFYPLLIYYIFLLHKASIASMTYLWLTLGTMIIYAILVLISHFQNN